jgi:hypothetical protein
MRKLLLSVLMLFFSAANWAATYIYQGNNYSTIIVGTTYSTSMHISGSFTTANPLPANLSSTDIGPTGSNLVQSWSFNDGVNTYTPANSYIVQIGFTVTTDSSGNISQYSIGIFSPLPPHALGDPISGIAVTSSDGVAAATGAPCLDLSDSTCIAANGASATGGFAISVPGTFSLAATSATPIPALTEWGMIILSSLLALGTVFTLRRQRQ